MEGLKHALPNSSSFLMWTLLMSVLLPSSYMGKCLVSDPPDGDAVAGVQCFTSHVSLGPKEGGKRKKQKQKEDTKKKKSTKGNR